MVSFYTAKAGYGIRKMTHPRGNGRKKPADKLISDIGVFT
jgi:hypothetical protein